MKEPRKLLEYVLPRRKERVPSDFFLSSLPAVEAATLPKKEKLPFLLKFLEKPEPPEHDFHNKNDFLFVPELYSAKKHLTTDLMSFLLVGGGVFFLAAVLLQELIHVSALTMLSGVITLFYTSLMVFKLYVVYHSISLPFLKFPEMEIQEITDEELPTYTILIPLYREEKVINQIIKAMTAIDYPAEKLDVIITLEEYDIETQEAIKRANPPRHFRTLILPNVAPKTKPKALNVAFLETKGEFLVIYDAEIIPDPDQLKKAYLAFRKHPDIACMQTRLDHYNTDQNILTKLFNAEFSFYYDLFLPGLQNNNFPIPLSGHSTHFRTAALKRVGAWDPYNVTEDCDLGMRLYRQGYKTAILDSFSKEEATSSVGAWICQRTRWMKGFMQTSLVHLRRPWHFKNEIGGWKNFTAFFFVVPASTIVNIFNLFYWILFILWITTHAKIIQSFFPGPILYTSVTSFIVGNLIFTYLNLLGVYRRGRYDLVKFSALSPLYWILLAIATTRAFIHIITKPHEWEKTAHGLHLEGKPTTSITNNQ